MKITVSRGSRRTSSCKLSMGVPEKYVNSSSGEYLASALRAWASVPRPAASTPAMMATCRVGGQSFLARSSVPSKSKLYVTPVTFGASFMPLKVSSWTEQKTTAAPGKTDSPNRRTNSSALS